MSEWQKIETAPKDGTPIRFRRIIHGRRCMEDLIKWIPSKWVYATGTALDGFEIKMGEEFDDEWMPK